MKWPSATVTSTQIRMLLFGWLQRVWGVPMWFEQTTLSQAGTTGDTTLYLDTANADYRVGGLVFVRNPQKQYEAFEIESMTDSSITINSNLINNYPINGSAVMPARTCYAKTQTTSSMYVVGLGKYSIQFTTLDNANLANWDTALWLSFAGYPVLGDINYVESTLSEGMDHNGVVVIDNTTGRVLQTSSIDRSRPRTVKTWWTNYASDIWPIRQLMHYLGGSQGLFWLPTNRDDFTLQANIDAGVAALTVSYTGYSAYAMDSNNQPMTPYAHLRITLTNGTQIYSTITGATSSFDGGTEEISLSAEVSGSLILISQVQRIEFLHLMRIADDKVTLTHDHAGRAQIVINCVGVRQ